ncbi:MAG: bifunctional methylenetetrahydrofolate dehydrogenase/methenyltetrahydrofolate cyclohydrolase FolD [Pseudomonadota bacterium]
MTARIIDGKAEAARLRAEVAEQVAARIAAGKSKPGLAVVLVGDDPASQVYVRNKVKFTEEVGMASFEHRLPAETSEAEVAALVRQLNADPAVHGILVQLPLPKHINEARVIEEISPEKDVDGLTQTSAGALALGRPGLRPCTPMGSVQLIKSVRENIAGANALVVGRSILVGKPLAQLLLEENCTVTTAHSRSYDLPGLCLQADILCAAVGRPEMIRGEWVKEGAIVVDIGINRVDAPEKGEGKTRLVGDVSFDEAAERASAITPVPGGVGPMTIANLLRNTVLAAG